MRLLYKHTPVLPRYTAGQQINIQEYASDGRGVEEFNTRYTIVKVNKVTIDIENEGKDVYRWNLNKDAGKITIVKAAPWDY